MDKLQYIYIMGYYTAVNLKKTIGTCNKMGESQKHNELKKWDIKENIYINLCKFLKNVN